MWFEIILFVLLQPGLLLTLPPVGKQVFMSGKTSVTAIVVHALIFAAIIYFKSSIPILRDIQGFQGGPNGGSIYKKGTIFLTIIDETDNIKAYPIPYDNNTLQSLLECGKSLYKDNKKITRHITYLQNNGKQIIAQLKSYDNIFGPMMKDLRNSGRFTPQEEADMNKCVSIGLKNPPPNAPVGE